MASDNAVYFVASSSDDEASDKEGQPSGRLHAPPSPYGSLAWKAEPSVLDAMMHRERRPRDTHDPERGPLTMETVLYRLPPPKPRHAPRPPSPGPPRGNQASAPPHSLPGNINGDTVEDLLESAVGRLPFSSLNNIEREEPPHCFAGGSACVMPAERVLPPTRTLPELRSMTSSDIREELRTFFLRKDAHVRRFKAVEAALLHGHDPAAANVTGGGPTSNNNGAGGPLNEAVKQKRDLPWMLDRCRRLVNVSNWDAAVDGYSQWDVLLPSALLPGSAVTEVPAAVGKGLERQGSSSSPVEKETSSATLAASAQAMTPLTTSKRNTLRPHQVEGIRFLWGVLAEGPVGQVPAVGCILAHTMGLGKTAQAVIFLHLFLAAFPGHAKPFALPRGGAEEAGTGDRRSTSAAFKGSGAASVSRRARVLVVVPKSTLLSWRREFRTWSESFPAAYRLHPLCVGERLSSQQRLDLFYEWRRSGGVLLVGFEALVCLMRLVEGDSVLHYHGDGDGAHPLDSTDAASHAFHRSNAGAAASGATLHERRGDLQARRNEGGVAFGGDVDPFTELVVCDEAHRLKSANLRAVKAISSLHPLRRLLLTGTPLQNHLKEYWAMIDFCVHRYFSRQRFHEYFIQPIESSATTRASEKEVKLARNTTFTLINEVRHFIQRVDSSPLRAELPPLHEYVIIVPLSPLQRDLYLHFIKLVLQNRTQKMLFLPAACHSGKITAHPQLLFQMGSASPGRGSAPQVGIGGGDNAAARRIHLPPQGTDAGMKRTSEAVQSSDTPGVADLFPSDPPKQRLRADTATKRSDVRGEDEGHAEAGQQDELTRSDADADDGTTSTSTSSGEEGEEEVFARATQRSFSGVCSTASLTYEELCVPPSPDYTPRLEDGTKLLVAMKLVAAAMQRKEKVLLFSFSTRLLTFVEWMIAKVNVEWCRPAEPSSDGESPRESLLPQPIRYCRLDGSHTALQRAATLDQFDRADGPHLFLLSIKAGGIGINITAATRVILLDTSFNPAADQQAIGRAYRYGQTRPVYVYRLMCYSTLEYSIFVQKLAKEWLFKTVVEETSVKRDGLSGMHLKELFSLLAKAAKTLAKPATATHAQAASTEAVLREDPALEVAKAELLYAQRYEVFLEHDAEDQYGEAEETFYRDYCRQKIFDRAENEEAERRRIDEMQEQRQQRINEDVQLRLQSRTLTHMVDDLIRTRSASDPNLVRLLTAMGLHVDAQTGKVRTSRTDAHHAAEGSRRIRDGGTTSPAPAAGHASFPPSPVQLVGVSYRGSEKEVVGPRTNETPQRTVILLDSDEESQKEAVERLEGDAARDGTQRVASASNAHSIAASLARQPYAPFRPGSSPTLAVDVDKAGSP